LAKQLADVTAQRDTVFKGETLRGLLLTSYSFSEFGTKAAQAATVAYFAAGLMLLLSIFGIRHAFPAGDTNLLDAPVRSSCSFGCSANSSLVPGAHARRVMPGQSRPP
jgi:hypothetical protein